MGDKKTTKPATDAEIAGSAAHWITESSAGNYAGATDFLSLSMPPAAAIAVVDRFPGSPLSTRRANDLLRASGLERLDDRELQVAKDLKRLRRGEKLPPVLVLRGDISAGRPLVIAAATTGSVPATWSTPSPPSRAASSTSPPRQGPEGRPHTALLRVFTQLVSPTDPRGPGLAT